MEKTSVSNGASKIQLTFDYNIIHVALCAQPPAPAHGRFSSHIGTKMNGEYLEGTQAVFECEPEYEANNQSTCQEDGTWSPIYNCVGNTSNISCQTYHKLDHTKILQWLSRFSLKVVTKFVVTTNTSNPFSSLFVRLSASGTKCWVVLFAILYMQVPALTFCPWNGSLFPSATGQHTMGSSHLLPSFGRQ